MQKKVPVILGFGFIVGLSFASCASSPDRTIAADHGVRYVSSTEEKEQKPKSCMTGEELNDDGDCVRPHNFDRPFRRGGR